MPQSHPSELKPFGSSAESLGISVLASAKMDGDHLVLRYEIIGEALPRVRIPDSCIAPSRRDRLWESTCLECFIADEGSATYLELNFSPNGDWNFYSFSAYREGMQAVTCAPQFTVTIRADRLSPRQFSLEARVPYTVIQDAFAERGRPQARVERLGLTAVVLTVGSETTYWALAHTAAQADFHRRDSFRLAWPADSIQS